MKTTVSLVFLCFVCSNFGFGDRTNKKIYINLETQDACVRHMNATHKIGCKSNYNGNVGTVYYIQSEDDMNWVVKEGPHSPYIVLLDGDDFNRTNVHKLRDSGRVNGIMVINIFNNSKYLQPEGFSSVDSCPNTRSGMYANNAEYRDCRKVTWNTYGSGLHFEDLGMPVFALTEVEDVENVLHKCFYQFNQRSNNTSYPICAAEVKTTMFAAVDSRTCIRRSERTAFSMDQNANKFCDTIGDQNVVSFLKDTSNKEKRDNNSVVVVATKLDASGLFQNEFRAAATAAVGVVTQLLVARALGTAIHDIKTVKSTKDIMFAFMNGETFNYMGSSRMVYDMEGDRFPVPSPSSDDTYISPLRLEHIDHILEISQVAAHGGKVWVHTDPLSSKTNKVKSLIEDLQKSNQSTSVEFVEADEDLPLPPASAQSFLKKRGNIPTMVVADHEREFSNKFYNSRLDTIDGIDASYPSDLPADQKYDYITPQAMQISNLSLALAQYLYKASTGKEPSSETLNMFENVTSDLAATRLLYCFLVSPNCKELLGVVSDESDQSWLKSTDKFNYYVGVSNSINGLTQVLEYLLSSYLGSETNLSKSDCKSSTTDTRYSYKWMMGPNACVKSLSMLTKAESPAWDIEGYDMLSGEFPTWTESRWTDNAFSIRLFLIPSNSAQLVTLCVGGALFLFSLLLAYWLHRKAYLLFQLPPSDPPTS